MADPQLNTTLTVRK